MMIILATCGNGYCGCDDEEVFVFEDDIDKGTIEVDLWEWACSNAESFSHVHFGWDEEYTDEEYEDYLENYVTYDWWEISYEDLVKWCENWGHDPEDYVKEERV